MRFKVAELTGGPLHCLAVSAFGSAYDTGNAATEARARLWNNMVIV